MEGSMIHLPLLWEESSYSDVRCRIASSDEQVPSVFDEVFYAPDRLLMSCCFLQLMSQLLQGGRTHYYDNLPVRGITFARDALGFFA
jgi:hypothetical protein